MYPGMARRMGVEGEVLVDVLVGSDGRVIETRKIRGHPVLLHAAIEAVSQWRFQPFVVGGQASPVVGRLRFEFSP